MNTNKNVDNFGLMQAMISEVEQGHSVFVLPAGGKSPYENCSDCPNTSGKDDPHYDVCECLPANGGTGTCHGFRAATQDIPTILGWAKKYPDSRLGVAGGPVSGNVICIEYDPDHGGLKSWEELLSVHGPMPLTRIDESPSTGQHFLIRLPEEMASQNIHGKLKTGVDIKGDGGYWITPPSQGYTTTVDAPVADAPKWIVNYIKQYMEPKVTPRLRESNPIDTDSVEIKETAQATVDYWLGRIVDAPNGNQNTLIYTASRVLGSLAFYNLLAEEDATFLLEKACDDGGHPYHRATGSIASGIRAGLRTPDSLEDLVNPDRTIINTFTWDDFGNAARVIYWRGEDIRYDKKRDLFYVWIGTHWEEAGKAEVQEIVTDVIKEIYATEGNFYSNDALQPAEGSKAVPKTRREMFRTWSATQGMSRKVTDCISAIKGRSEIWCTNEDFDQQPYKLNLANGVMDLKTFEITPHSREWMFTVTLGVAGDESAVGANWDRFMKMVMPNREHREYVQRLAGMTLLGEVLEQVFILNVGEGGLGKGVFIQVIEKILGSYAIRADRKAFIGAGSQRSFEMYGWEGKRLVYTDEIGNTKLNGEWLKDITGGDKLSVEGKGLKHKEFTPQFTIWMRSNSIPQMTNESAMERRFLLVKWLGKKFTSEDWDSFKDEDNRIVPKFLYNTEASGILNWLLAGLKDYQQRGQLDIPKDWDEEAKALLVENDFEAQFVRENVEITDNPADNVAQKALYAAYVDYYNENVGNTGEYAKLGSKSFNARMVEAFDFVRDNNNNRPRWTGIQLRNGVIAVGSRK